MKPQPKAGCNWIWAFKRVCKNKPFYKGNVYKEVAIVYIVF